MSEVLEDEILEDEEDEMGSLNHSLIQGKITTFLSNDEKYVAMPELSLDASQIDLSQFGLKTKEELKPDICVYSKKGPLLERGDDDILRVSEMPLLAVEILSPEQRISVLIAKIKAFFALGIKSCWLVIPVSECITVYSKSKDFKSFTTNNTELIDEVMDIRLPIRKIFEW